MKYMYTINIQRTTLRKISGLPFATIHIVNEFHLLSHKSEQQQLKSQYQ